MRPRPCLDRLGLFVAVVVVVGFGCVFRVTPGMDCVRPRQMSMVSRFLVMAGLMVLRSFAMMSSSVTVMLLCLLVVFDSFL
jgi:hypothetical protein